MLKSCYVDIYFETKEDKASFDTWVESREDLKGMTIMEIALEINDYFQSQTAEEEIDGCVFGKNGNQVEYLESIGNFLNGLY